LRKLKVRRGTIACAWLEQAGYLMKTSGGEIATPAQPAS
jgi:hypothetical protein